MTEISILCVQLVPIHFDPAASMAKADLMLASYSSADIIVLPEMAFSGYSFTNREEIAPMLEEPNNSFPTFRWCAQLARRLHGNVFCGYPEKSVSKAYNSMMVLSPEGNLLQNYRKKFLFHMDKTWAAEGEEYKTTEICIRGKWLKIGLGICMDICPYEFTAPFDSFELSNWWKSQAVDLCVFCTNWIKWSDETAESQEVINYWVSRLTPLIQQDKTTYFIAADRVGIEKGTVYMGTSCVIRLCMNPEPLAMLDKTAEAVLHFNLKANN